MQSPPTAVLPQEISQVPYNELRGLIKLEDSNAFFKARGGGYSDVLIGYLTEDTGKETKVAVKVLRVVPDKENIDKIKKYLIRETVVWQRLQHPNILKFLGLDSGLGKYDCPALISPYCDNETVDDYLKKHPNLCNRLIMIKGVSEGLTFLHAKDVIHGDLKPPNILVNDDGHPLLCDFGCSRILTQRGFTTKPAGTCRYQAPELFKDDNSVIKVNEATDVYAFAVTSYQIWTGLLPFGEIKTDYFVISNVLGGVRPRYPNPAPPGSDALWNLFKDCWGGEPNERLSMEVVVQRLANMNVPSQ